MITFEPPDSRGADVSSNAPPLPLEPARWAGLNRVLALGIPLHVGLVLWLSLRSGMEKEAVALSSYAAVAAAIGFGVIFMNRKHLHSMLFFVAGCVLSIVSALWLAVLTWAVLVGLALFA